MARPTRVDNTWWVAKRYWRNFLPMWVFPVAFFFSVFVPGFATAPREFFFFVVAPIFFACYWTSSAPVRRRQVSVYYGIIWTILVPVGIWFVVVGGFWGLAFLLGAFG
jgi:hypothetical protein